MNTFIIEHPTRGTLSDFVSPEEFKFSIEGLRGDPDKTMQFGSYFAAKRVLDKLPEKVAEKCEIRSSAKRWEVVKS